MDYEYRKKKSYLWKIIPSSLIVIVQHCVQYSAQCAGILVILVFMTSTRRTCVDTLPRLTAGHACNSQMDVVCILHVYGTWRSKCLGAYFAETMLFIGNRLVFFPPLNENWLSSVIATWLGPLFWWLLAQLGCVRQCNGGTGIYIHTYRYIRNNLGNYVCAAQSSSEHSLGGHKMDTFSSRRTRLSVELWTATVHCDGDMAG